MSSVQRITFKPAQQIKNGLKTKSENGKLVVSTLLENKDKIKKMSKKNDISVKNLNVKLSKNKIDYSLPESSDGSFSKFNQSGDLKNNENQLKVNYKDIVYYFNMNKNNEGVMSLEPANPVEPLVITYSDSRSFYNYTLPLYNVEVSKDNPASYKFTTFFNKDPQDVQYESVVKLKTKDEKNNMLNDFVEANENVALTKKIASRYYNTDINEDTLTNHKTGEYFKLQRSKDNIFNLNFYNKDGKLKSTTVLTPKMTEVTDGSYMVLKEDKNGNIVPPGSYKYHNPQNGISFDYKQTNYYSDLEDGQNKVVESYFEKDDTKHEASVSLYDRQGKVIREHKKKYKDEDTFMTFIKKRYIKVANDAYKSNAKNVYAYCDQNMIKLDDLKDLKV